MSGKRLLLNCPLLIITLILACSSRGAGEISEPIQVEKDKARMEKTTEPAAARPAGPAGPKEPQQQPGKILVEFYIMSKCPFTAAVQQKIKNVLDKMGDCVDFKQYFIASEIADGSFVSLHGDSEVRGDIVELCAVKYGSKGNRYMDYILCRNEDIQSPDWKDCAKKSKIKPKKIEKCAAGQEGLNLLKAHAQLAADLGFKGSPTFLINNKEEAAIQGKDRTVDGIIKAICNYNEKLEGCP